MSACLLAACSSEPASHVKPGGTQVTLHVSPTGTDAADADEQQVLQGVQMIQDGKIMAAIDGPLNAVVNKYETRYAGGKATIYSARNTTDAMLYAGLAMTAVPHGQVEVLGPAWAMAYWARGFAYGEMARYDDERRELEKALALAPFDAQYNNELAYVFVQKRDWANALAHYKTAEEYADITAPGAPHVKCVAFRGQGFVLVEQHKLDEAEARYRECLKITPDEPKSLGEIGYIQELRKKQH
jgi:tetratricopeptide (TPR) repeat protein